MNFQNNAVHWTPRHCYSIIIIYSSFEGFVQDCETRNTVAHSMTHFFFAQRKVNYVYDTSFANNEMVTSIIKQRKSVIPLDPVLVQSVVLLDPVKLKKQFEHIASEHSRSFANIPSPPPPRSNHLGFTSWSNDTDSILSSEMFEDWEDFIKCVWVIGPIIYERKKPRWLTFRIIHSWRIWKEQHHFDEN